MTTCGWPPTHASAPRAACLDHETHSRVLPGTRRAAEIRPVWSSGAWSNQFCAQGFAMREFNLSRGDWVVNHLVDGGRSRHHRVGRKSRGCLEISPQRSPPRCLNERGHLRGDPCGPETTRPRWPHRPSRDVLARPVRRHFRVSDHPPGSGGAGEGSRPARPRPRALPFRPPGPGRGHRPAPRRAIGLPPGPLQVIVHRADVRDAAQTKRAE